MQGETEERPRKRRKKKSRFGYYLYAAVMLILTIVNITLAVLLLTYVQDIEVTGTEISEESEVVSWITEDPLTKNSLYALWKYNMGSQELPVYLKDVDVRLKAPWALEVAVTEKEKIACVSFKNKYVYFDKDGLVLQMTGEKEEDLWLIEGVAVTKAALFETMEAKEEKIVSYIHKMLRGIEKEGLSPDRIVWEEDSMNLYFGGVCAQLGKANYDVKLEQLPPILKKLEGKTGVLRMEHYSETSDNISFEGR